MQSQLTLGLHFWFLFEQVRDNIYVLVVPHALKFSDPILVLTLVEIRDITLQRNYEFNVMSYELPNCLQMTCTYQKMTEHKVLNTGCATNM